MLMLNALLPHSDDAGFNCATVTETYVELNLAVCSPHAACKYACPYRFALGSVKKGLLHLHGSPAAGVSARATRMQSGRAHAMHTGVVADGTQVVELV